VVLKSMLGACVRGVAVAGSSAGAATIRGSERERDAASKGSTHRVHLCRFCRSPERPGGNDRAAKMAAERPPAGAAGETGL